MRDKAYQLLFDILHDDSLSASIENTYYEHCKNQKIYAQKIRSLVYNLKHNNTFYDDVIQGKYDHMDIVQMNPRDMNIDVWKPTLIKIEKKKQRLINSIEKISTMC